MIRHSRLNLKKSVCAMTSLKHGINMCESECLESEVANHKTCPGQPRLEVLRP